MLYGLLVSLRRAVSELQQNVLQLRSGAQGLGTSCFALCSQPAPGVNVPRSICVLPRVWWLAVKTVARYLVCFLLSPRSGLFHVLEEAGC